MGKYDNQTPVIFRKWKPRKEFGEEGGDIIALFPADVGTMDPYTCSSYEQIGQHGSADPVGVMRATKPATPGEYADLLAELKRIGYDDLRIYQKLQSDFLEERKRKLRAFNVPAPKSRSTKKSTRPRRKRGSNPLTSVGGIRR